MEQELVDAIKKAIDKSIEEFLDQPDSIFNNKKEQLVQKFSVINELKNWKKNRICIVKGCSNKSIENSHTIAKSSSIKLISENGHVITPIFNVNTGELEMSKVGINDASTFPGYCIEHEKLFSGFERAKDFENGEHFGLQLYRTVCREIVIKENQLREIDILIDRYKVFRDKKIGELVLSKLDEKTLNTPTLEFQGFKITNNDYRLINANKHKKETIRYLHEFLYVYQDAILKDLKNRRFSNIVYTAINFNRVIPVALAGRGNFSLKLKTMARNVELIFNVLPLKDKTYLFVSTLKKFEEELKYYMQHHVNPLQAVSMVENWMVHGTDHWFIKPSIWEMIDSKYQSEILSEILNEDCNIGDELKFSIFNDLKSESISLMEDNFDTLDDILIELLNLEKAKITSRVFKL